MTFTQIPDTWADAPDVLSVSRSARLLEVEGKGYCNRHLTDGLITRGQWLRATDSETFAEDLQELMDAGLVTSPSMGYYQLDWEHQQTREQVETGRARRRADNERRAKSLEQHKAGDHSLCTHEGGGRARQAGETSSRASSGPSTDTSISTSTGKSTGPSNGRKGGRSNGASRGRSMVGSPNPPQPSPTQPVVERRVGGDGLAADGSAGAPPSADGALPEAAGTPQPVRRFQGVDVTPAMIGGQDPNGVDEFTLESLLVDHFYAAGVDPAAESLDGLVAVGGADK